MPPSRLEVVRLLSFEFMGVYDDELYSPSGESSLSEERGSVPGERGGEAAGGGEGVDGGGEDGHLLRRAREGAARRRSG